MRGKPRPPTVVPAVAETAAAGGGFTHLRLESLTYQPKMPLSPQPQMADSQEAEIAAYRAVSKAAATGLLLGLLSPTVLIDQVLLGFALIGTLWNALFLWLFRQDLNAMIGRKALQVGLILSLFFGATGLTDQCLYEYVVRREACQFSRQWFDFLAQDRPQKAYQLTLHPRYRPPLDDATLEGLYRPGSAAEKELENYRDQPLILALTALGARAQVRYYQTDGLGHTGERDVVFQTYAVTYEEAGEKKSFFVRLEMYRLRLTDGRAEWQLSRATGGGKPTGL